MKEYGLENCKYEVVEDSFTSIGKLALAEIRYIKQYNSFKDGLNSSTGGDGFGKYGLKDLPEEEILSIKLALGETFRQYNKKKWANTTPEQRKEMVKNAFTPEVNAERAKTLKEYYKANPDVIEAKSAAMIISRNKDKEYRDMLAKKASKKGAEKVSKKVKIEFQNGDIKIYNSKSEFNRENGIIVNRILKKTKENKSHRGFKGWEL